MRIVHGGIRHLENCPDDHQLHKNVHGGIRHLEKTWQQFQEQWTVHGGIRHLEIHVFDTERR